MKTGKPVRLPHMASYDVGYKKPPQAGQFIKGRSGNPAGRPKGARNRLQPQMLQMRDMLLNEAYRNVTIQDKSGPLTLPVAQAAMRSLALKAAQGNVSAQKLLLQSLHYAESEKINEQTGLFKSAIAFRERAYAAIAYSEKHGIPLEETLPHPDHVITDAHTCGVTFIGPMDQKDKALWDTLWARKAKVEKAVRRLQKTLKKEPDCEQLKHGLAHMQYVLELTEQAIIVRWHRSVDEIVKDPRRRYETQQRIEKGILPQRPKPEQKRKALR